LWLFHLLVKQGLDSCFSSLGDQHRFHSAAPLIFVALVRGRKPLFFSASSLFCVQLITTAGGIDLLIGQWFHLIDNKVLDNLPAELKLSRAATGGLLVLLQQIVPCC